MVIALLASSFFVYYVSIGNVLSIIALSITLVCLYLGIKATYQLAVSEPLQGSRKWPLMIATMGAMLGLAAAGIFEGPVTTLALQLVPSFLVEPAGLPGLFEEIAKQFGVLIIALSSPALLSTKRNVYTLGLAAGLGFGILEDIFYIGTSLASPLVRILALPAHPMWSAMAAIGIALAVPSMSGEVGVVANLRALLSAQTMTPFALVFFLHELWDVGNGVGLFLSLPLTLAAFIGMYRYLPANLAQLKFDGPTRFTIGIFTSLRKPRPTVESV